MPRVELKHPKNVGAKWTPFAASMRERFTSWANMAMASDSLASAASNSSVARCRKAVCASSAIEMSDNKNIRRKPIVRPKKNSPPQRSGWYRALMSRPFSLGRLIGHGAGPARRTGRVPKSVRKRSHRIPPPKGDNAQLLRECLEYPGVVEFRLRSARYYRK